VVDTVSTFVTRNAWPLSLPVEDEALDPVFDAAEPVDPELPVDEPDEGELLEAVCPELVALTFCPTWDSRSCVLLLVTCAR
jgi:hypothetical protein